MTRYVALLCGVTSPSQEDRHGGPPHAACRDGIRRDRPSQPLEVFVAFLPAAVSPAGTYIAEATASDDDRVWINGSEAFLNYGCLYPTGDEHEARFTGALAGRRSMVDRPPLG